MADEPPVTASPGPPDGQPRFPPPRATQSIAGLLLVALGVVFGFVGLLVVTAFAARPNGAGSVLFAIVLCGGSSAVCIVGGVRVIRGQR